MNVQPDNVWASSRQQWMPLLQKVWSRVRPWPVRSLIFAIEFYRTCISPLKVPCCRFTPTCSEYAVDALREHGLLKGLWLAGVRLLKCGPWHPGGWDPVPERRHSAEPGEEPSCSDPSSNDASTRTEQYAAVGSSTEGAPDTRA